VGAPSGAPHHVGMYVGDGMVVVAPHTGARVRFEPLAAGGWDGFARLMPAANVAPAADPAVEAAARAHQVPPYALAAELQLGLATDPDAAAAALARALRRHRGNLAAALGEALGDPSAGAFVLRSASGSALPGFSAGVRLLPLPADEPSPPAAPLPPAGGSGVDVPGVAGTVGKGLERGAEQIDHIGAKLAVQAVAGFRNLLRFGLTGAAVFLPDPHLRNLATIAGAAWDGVESVIGIVRGGVELHGYALWAGRVTVPLGLTFAGIYAWQAWTARRREDQIWLGAQAASGFLTSVGAMSAGTGLIMAGAGTAEVPPLGAFLMVLGVAVLAGGCIYHDRRWLGSQVRSGAGWVRKTAGRAAGAVLDAGRSVASALNPF